MSNSNPSKELRTAYETEVQSVGMRMFWSQFDVKTERDVYDIYPRIEEYVQGSEWSTEPYLAALLAEWGRDMILDLLQQFEIQREREYQMYLTATRGCLV
jgi:hypothetical protein|tara:strand:+ start:285 stop:584 length:300 start_codon:yes stop_codon:yes gene_type:complete